MHPQNIFLLSFLTVIPVLAGAKDYRVVCYYTNWAQYRGGKARFLPENIDPSLCTHIIYAFADLEYDKENDKVQLNAFEWNDESKTDFEGMYERFQKVLSKFSNVKKILAVGGWDKYTKPFDALISNDYNRQYFANATIRFLRKHYFDGLDLHWKYSVNKINGAIRKIQLVQLMQALKSAFSEENQRTHKPRLLLILSANVQTDVMTSPYQAEAICRFYTDFINVLTYDFHGPWAGVTGHFSPIFKPSTRCTDFAMKFWTNRICGKEKLNVGIALFGRSFTLKSPNDDVYAPASAGNRGRYTLTQGFLAYYESKHLPLFLAPNTKLYQSVILGVMTKRPSFSSLNILICIMKNDTTKEIYRESEKASYMVHGNQWISYDNWKNIRYKVCYAKKYGFGGVMIWALDLDDFNGEFCGKGKWPVLNSVKNEIKQKRPCFARRTTLSPKMNSKKTKEVDKNYCRGKQKKRYYVPKNCSVYYDCTIGITLVKSCAPGTFFNFELQECVYRHQTTCGKKQKKQK